MRTGDGDEQAVQVLRLEQLGERSAGLSLLGTVALALVAGVFVALGAVAATTTVAGSTMPFGLTRLFGGVVGALGFALALLTGAQVFVGNNGVVMAWVGGRLRFLKVVRLWTLVLAGNAVGAMCVVGLVFVSGHHLMGRGVVGATTLAIAHGKCQLDPVQALALGVLGAVSLGLAVWLGDLARSSGARLALTVPPLAVLGLVGFEHVVANLYYVPAGLLIKLAASSAFWEATGRVPADYPALTIDQFVVNNLLPVLMGNLLGGGALLAVLYWAIFARSRG
ncbi:MAG: formate transporter [Kiritimatiellia bacterium]|jgi:formate transporter